MAPVDAELAELERSSAHERSQGYNNLLHRILSSNDDAITENLIAYVQSITSDNVGVINSRPLLSTFVEQFRAYGKNDVKLSAG